MSRSVGCCCCARSRAQRRRLKSIASPAGVGSRRHRRRGAVPRRRQRVLPRRERAQDVRARIVVVADDPRIAPNAVMMQPREGRIDILAANRHLVAVVAADASLEGVSLSDAALVRTMRIRETIERYRFDRSPESLAQAALAATLAAAIAGVCCSSCCAASATRFRGPRTPLSKPAAEPDHSIVRGRAGGEHLARHAGRTRCAAHTVHPCDRLCVLRIRPARVSLDARRRALADQPRRRAARSRWARRCFATSRSWPSSSCSSSSSATCSSCSACSSQPSAPGACRCAASMRNGRNRRSTSCESSSCCSRWSSRIPISPGLAAPRSRACRSSPA